MTHAALRIGSNAVCVAALAITLSWAGVAPAQTSTPPGTEAMRACPATAQGIRQPTDCVCTVTAVEAEAPVWGADTYTDDSSICRAALHAGVVTLRGGTIRVTPGGSQPSYAASERNGVTTMTYGPYERSFSVAASEVKGVVDANQCAERFDNYRSRSGIIDCTCAAEQTAEGTVWGTDVYTDDSSICRAAVHAGVIPPAGGAVRAQTVPGRQSYEGSTRNGVQTEDYGPWEGAFSFAR